MSFRRPGGGLLAPLIGVLAVVALVVVAPSTRSGATDQVGVLGPPAATVPVYDHDAPDPDVISVTPPGEATTYYAYTTQAAGRNVPVLTSSDLRTWTVIGDALPALPDWASPGFVWAPGVVELGGDYVMYYSTFVPGSQSFCISEATSPSPTGPFVDRRDGPLECQAALGGSIDPSPFVDQGGAPYLYWKSNGGLSDTAAQIWEAPLNADGSEFTGTPTPVLAQDEPWETTVESPDMVLVGGQYVLFYSGGHWDDAGYGVGYARCAGPAGPCDKPFDGPILHSDRHRLGPGGESLFRDGEGDLYMAYSAWDGPSSNFSYGDGEYRGLWIAAVTFDGTVPQVHAGEPPEGYVLAAADGGVFAFGDAVYRGSMGGRPLAAPVVGMAPTPDGGGYWLVASDGGVFAFGDAVYSGSMGRRPLAAPVVGMAAMPQGGGYWLVGADGGIFNFGRAEFFGSMGAHALARPVVAVMAGPGAGGYWLVGADGGIFTFGDSAFLGSEGGAPMAAPVVGAGSTS